MRILTVRQPWAWAIIHGGKDVENRTRNLAGDYRGPVAIHAAKTVVDGPLSPLVARRIGELSRRGMLPDFAPAVAGGPDGPNHETAPWYAHRGGIIGVVDLVDVHSASVIGGCGWIRHDCPEHGTCRNHCSEWGEGPAPDGWLQHLVFENPRQLIDPIPYGGALGLRRLPAEVETEIMAQIGDLA